MGRGSNPAFRRSHRHIGAGFIKLGVPTMADRPLSIDIKHPLLIKNADLFLITDRDGSVPQAPPGFGLFYRDCCYLSRYDLSLNGTRPLALMFAWDEGFSADIELTNANLRTSNETPIDTHMLGIKRKLLLIGDECVFVDVLTFRSFSQDDLELPFALHFTAGFESMFVLRGTPPGKRGTMHAPECGRIAMSGSATWALTKFCAAWT